jgi:hypothetical protein
MVETGLEMTDIITKHRNPSGGPECKTPGTVMQGVSAEVDAAR